jgi:hypothetical protein
MYFIIWIAQRVCRKIAKNPSFEMNFKALLVAIFGKSLIEWGAMNFYYRPAISERKYPLFENNNSEQ